MKGIRVLLKFLVGVWVVNVKHAVCVRSQRRLELESKVKTSHTRHHPIHRVSFVLECA
jgi:hypothetical protein